MSNNSFISQMYHGGQRHAKYVEFWHPVTVANVKSSITALVCIKYMTGRMGTKIYVAPR